MARQLDGGRLVIARHNPGKVREIAELLAPHLETRGVSVVSIAELGLDILIYADLGMEGITYTLAFSRLAPVQCVMWGHPSTSGISTIDYFLSSELAEADSAEVNYSEKLIRFKNLPLYYFRPPTAPQRVREDFNLPSDTHVYGCPHSTFKLHPQFDFVIGELTVSSDSRDANVRRDEIRNMLQQLERRADGGAVTLALQQDDTVRPFSMELAMRLLTSFLVRRTPWAVTLPPMCLEDPPTTGTSTLRTTSRSTIV